MKTTNQISRKYMTRMKQFGQMLAKRDGGWYCHYCFIPLVKIIRIVSPEYAQATIDHKHALAKGGADRPPNMVLACQKCNCEKADQDYGAFYAATAHRRQTPYPQLQRPYPGTEESEDIYDNEGR